MNNVFKKSTVLFALLAILTGGGITSCKEDSDSGDSQPEYVGKIYSAKDGKSYLKIDTKDTATYYVWEEGSDVQESARAAESNSSISGHYVEHQGKYTVDIVDDKEMFSLKINWTDDDGNKIELKIEAELANGNALVNFKVNDESVEFVKIKIAPKDPDNVVIDEDKSDEDDSGDGDVTVPEDLVKIPAVSIDGTETWTPSSPLEFMKGRAIEIPAFYISDHEVTRGEYKALIGNDPSTASAYDENDKKVYDDKAGNNPVNYVNWYDAIVYCNKLSAKEKLTPCYTINGSKDPNKWGDIPTESSEIWNEVSCDFEADGYRLPTDVEWEWAARGGEHYTYAGSDNSDEVAWCYPKTKKLYGTKAVKTMKANGYGLYDMSGNVAEWCWDWFGRKTENTPFSGLSSGTYRSIRGGDWKQVDNYCVITEPTKNSPSCRGETIGFRVVRSVK